MNIWISSSFPSFSFYLPTSATRGTGQGLLHNGVIEDVHELCPFQRAAAVLRSRPWRGRRSRCLGCYIAGRTETGNETRNSKCGLYYWPFSRPSSSNFMTYLLWWTSNHFAMLALQPTKRPKDFSPSVAPSLLLQRGVGCSPAPVAAAAANVAPGHRATEIALWNLCQVNVQHDMSNIWNLKKALVKQMN